MAGQVTHEARLSSVEIRIGSPALISRARAGAIKAARALYPEHLSSQVCQQARRVRPSPHDTKVEHTQIRERQLRRTEVDGFAGASARTSSLGREAKGRSRKRIPAIVEAPDAASSALLVGTHLARPEHRHGRCAPQLSGVEDLV